MEVIVCKDGVEVAQRAHLWVARLFEQKRFTRFFVPAGATPQSLYQFWRQEKPGFLKDLTFIQIDEVLTGPKAGLFREFFTAELKPWLHQFKWIQDANEGADAAILGLGLNGHVAFHEPYLPPQFFSGCVKLDQTTCSRLELEPGTWGISYGLGAFMQCQDVLLVVTGSSKQKILSQFLGAAGDFPALELHRHRSLTVLVDQAALPLKK